MNYQNLEKSLITVPQSPKSHFQIFQLIFFHKQSKTRRLIIYGHVIILGVSLNCFSLLKWLIRPPDHVFINIFICSDVLLIIQNLLLCSVCSILNVSPFSPQLGIRISLSHEKEPLGTGEFLFTTDKSRQTWNYLGTTVMCFLNLSSVWNSKRLEELWDHQMYYILLKQYNFFMKHNSFVGYSKIWIEKRAWFYLFKLIWCIIYLTNNETDAETLYF